MTTEVLSPTMSTTKAATRSPLLVAGLKEAKRMLRSPAYLLIFGFLILTGGVESIQDGVDRLLDPAIFYEMVIYYSGLWIGLVTYLAAHLVTSSARRTGADQQLGSSPVDERGRGLAMCIGVVLGPFVVIVGLLVCAAILASNTDVSTPDGLAPFSIVELTQLALSIVGGGIFGVVLATWLRFPGSLILGFIFLVFSTLMIIGSGDVSDVTPWLAWTATAPSWIDSPWALTGSQTWHAAYLAGMCGLGVCAVAMKQREGRRPWLIASACALALTVAAALLQS